MSVLCRCYHLIPHTGLGLELCQASHIRRICGISLPTRSHLRIGIRSCLERPAICLDRTRHLSGIRCLLPLTSTTRWTGPGKVLLFPCKTTHSRIFSRRHSFAYSYLVAGIPVGWEGVSGGLVSSSSRNLSWLSLTNTCWFKVDPADHLERGDAHLGLRGKLDAYLKSEVRAGNLEF